MLINKILRNVEATTAIVAVILGLILLFSIQADNSGKGLKQWQSGNVTTTTNP